MIETAEYTETEERIFEAALRVFAQKGKDGARMQEIADAAGINKALLHYYFRSKDGLYEAVFNYVFHHFLDSFGKAMQETASFEETLRTFINGYVDYVRDHLDVMRLMVNAHLSGGEAMGQRLRRYMESSEAAPPRVLSEKILAAVAEGEIRPVDPFQTALTALSGCIFFFLIYPTVEVIAPAAADRDAFIGQRKAHLFDLLFHGLKPRSDG